MKFKIQVAVNQEGETVNRFPFFVSGYVEV